LHQNSITLATPVSITSIASVSPLGDNPDTIWQNYNSRASFVVPAVIGGKTVPVGRLPEDVVAKVQQLRDSLPNYKHLDDTVLYAVLASRAAMQKAGWAKGDDFGINIGSSRGATGLFEQHYEDFLATGKAALQASPATTLGNISSWVAQDLQNNGPDISHSITCSTALHALLNGVAWLRSGMANKFMVGGSEASLTPFTIAQMQAMKIYSNAEGDYPCRALDMEKTQNTMVLGEGAASACLELGKKDNALAYIEGVGYATEVLQHSVSISADAECLEKSMRMALKDTDLSEVDAVVMHAPGTIKGDSSELNAIKNIFGDTLPMLTTNKWKIGHTFGASGLLSLELALMMLKHNRFIEVPFSSVSQNTGMPIRKVLINAVGFGGNAVSVLLSK
jgi:3-oxoacyl-(acyl-carrier-protein) synthase